MRQLGVAFRAGATLSCRTCFVIIFEECYDLRNLENTIFFTKKRKFFNVKTEIIIFFTLELCKTKSK